MNNQNVVTASSGDVCRIIKLINVNTLLYLNSRVKQPIIYFWSPGSKACFGHTFTSQNIHTFIINNNNNMFYFNRTQGCYKIAQATGKQNVFTTNNYR